MPPKPPRQAARHEPWPAFHQQADPGDGAVHRAPDCRCDRLHHAAGGGISASRAADRGGHHAISGASAQTVSDTVAAPIEQQINGVEDMLYLYSQATSDGQLTITVTFKLGTDLDKAQVLVQNRVAIAQPQLPQEVQRNGVVTRKNSPDILMVVFMLSPDDSFDQLYISNYALLQVRDQLLRLDGIATSGFSARAIIRCGCGWIPTRSPTLE